MGKCILKRSLALMLMMLLLCFSVAGSTREPAVAENPDAEGAEVITESTEEEKELQSDEDSSGDGGTLEIASEGMTETAAPEAAEGGSTETVAPEAAEEGSTETAAPEAAGGGSTEAAAEAGTEADATAGEQEKKDIMILFTSDIHCGVDRGFGLAGVQQIRETLEKQGYETLLVDDGDAIQGETIGATTKGTAVIDLMNEMKYDVAIPGNHEFDYGMDNFFKIVEQAEFPYLSCNFTKADRLVFDPYIIKEIGGLKIGFVGVTTPETITSSTPKYFQNDKGEFVYGFMQDRTGEKLYAAVQSAVDGAKAEGADLIYLIAHLGNLNEARPWTYADVVSHTTGIDVVMDGHSHDTDQVVMKNKDGESVVRSAVGTKLNSLGYSHISSDGEILETNIWSWTNNESAPELFGIDNKIFEDVEKKEEEVNEKLEVKVGESRYDLLINDPEAKDTSGAPIRMIRRAETNLGDFCADAFRIQAGTDIGFITGGGVRANLNKGEVSLKDLLTVFPFNNQACILEVTGQQMLDALEWGSRDVPGECGGFMQVSGLTYEIHSYIDSTCTKDDYNFFTGVAGERRVRNVKVGGEDLDPEKKYTVCSLDYTMLNHGDGFTMFDGANVIEAQFKLDLDALEGYLTDSLGGVIGEQYADPYGDGRIVIVDEKPEN